MKEKLCFKCDKNFVPFNRTINWCDECREALKLPSLEILPRPPIEIPKIQKPKPKKEVIDAWESIYFPRGKDNYGGEGSNWLKFKYWNGLELYIPHNEISADPEYWAALRDIRLILQRFRGKEK